MRGELIEGELEAEMKDAREAIEINHCSQKKLMCYHSELNALPLYTKDVFEVTKSKMTVNINQFVLSKALNGAISAFGRYAL